MRIALASTNEVFIYIIYAQTIIPQSVMIMLLSLMNLIIWIKSPRSTNESYNLNHLIDRSLKALTKA